MTVILRFDRMALSAALLLVMSTGASLGAPSPANPTPAPSAAPATPSGGESEPRRPLWEYKKELGLTDQQVAKMQTAVEDLKKLARDSEEQLDKLDRQLSEQITNNAPIDVIKTTLEQIANIQINFKLADVKASRTVNECLTPEQRQKWHAIQAQASQTQRAPQGKN